MLGSRIIELDYTAIIFIYLSQDKTNPFSKCPSSFYNYHMKEIYDHFSALVENFTKQSGNSPLTSNLSLLLQFNNLLFSVEIKTNR